MEGRASLAGAVVIGCSERDPTASGSKVFAMIVERTDEVRVELTTNPMSAEQRRIASRARGFGEVFSEHMGVAEFTSGAWGVPRVVPFGPLPMSPGASVFHYGQAVFEGFKAYRQAGGGVATFRAIENAKRFNASASRLAMPPIDSGVFMALCDALIRADAAWVPEESGESLYIRPLMIAADVSLALRPSDRYLFFVLASPAGNFFQGGARPVNVWVSEQFVRAAAGGTGAAKCAGNYAGGLLAQQQALANGCDQVVWLDAVHRAYVEEMGGMNLFFVERDDANASPRLVTPELSGALLPGVTRDSVIQLARRIGYTVEERRFSMAEWEAGARSGRISEAFACGTAAVITPIGRVVSSRTEFAMATSADPADEKACPIAHELRRSLIQLQYGRAPDDYGWLRRVI